MENGITSGTTNIHVSNIIDIKILPLLLAWGVLYLNIKVVREILTTFLLWLAKNMFYL